MLYWFHASARPHGDWDAMAIWNVRARMIHGHGFGVLASGIDTGAHPDYPPLQPLIVAAGWHLVGNTTVLVPILLHGAVMLTVLTFFRRWPQLLVGAVILPYGASQYVDLPIALMLLIAAAAYRRRNQFGVGAALAIALLLKNEGLLIALAFYGVWIIKDREIPWRAIAITSVGLALLLVYKLWVGVGNDVMSSTGMLDRIGDWYRYAVVLVAGVVALVMFGTGALPVLLLGVGLERHKVQVDVPLIACGVILLGYWAIYIITPHDLAWHIQSSYDRLLLHLFPAAAYSLSQ